MPATTLNEQPSDRLIEQQTAVPGISELVDSLFETWRRLGHTRLTLFALEIRRAGLGFSTIVGMAVAAGCLLASTWLIFMALTLYWAIDNGLGWGIAGAIMLAANLVAIGILIAAIRTVGEHLTFAATRRSLRGAQTQAHKP